MGRPNLEHVQDDLGIFQIIFVPTVVKRFSRPGAGQR